MCLLNLSLISELYFRSILLCFLILQFNGLVKHSLIALDFAFLQLFLPSSWSFWGRFSFVIWSFREFPHFKICFASFCSDFGKFIHSFSSLFEISAKFCHFVMQLPGFSPRKFNLLTSQVAPKRSKHSFCFIFYKQSELKQFFLYELI